MKTLEEIDLIKRKIEVKYVPQLKKIFQHIAADAKALYLADKKIPIKQLVQNYNPEFLKVIRDAQRETIKIFGFDIREAGEAKGYLFKTAKYRALFNYQVETKDIPPITDENAIEKVNRNFALDASLFVANSSEDQVDYIEQTNIDQISDAEKLAVILFFSTQADLQKKVETITSEISKVDFEELLGGSQSLAGARKKKLQQQLKEAQSQLQDFNASKDKFIAQQIQIKIEDSAPSRSDLIASQNVGMAESWARQKEAEMVNEAVPEMQLKKRWVALLDNRTRSSHVIADGQEVSVDQNFLVGGYTGKMPRDEDLPIEETANCRCVAIYINGAS